MTAGESPVLLEATIRVEGAEPSHPQRGRQAEAGGSLVPRHPLEGSSGAGWSASAQPRPGWLRKTPGGGEEEVTTVTRQVITWKPGNERLRVNFSGENGRNWPERVQSVKVLGENPVTFMKGETERS